MICRAAGERYRAAEIRTRIPGADLNRERRYILSIIACPNPEHETFFASGIWRAKS